MKNVTIYTDGGDFLANPVNANSLPLAGQPLAWQARAV